MSIVPHHVTARPYKLQGYPKVLFQFRLTDYSVLLCRHLAEFVNVEDGFCWRDRNVVAISRCCAAASLF